jgi:hypothetical protein
MRDKYKVFIPIDPYNTDNGYKEFIFQTRQQVQDFINVSENTLNTMIHRKISYTQPKHKHLLGIKVERINLTEDKCEQKEIDPVEFQKKLLDSKKD